MSFTPGLRRLAPALLMILCAAAAVASYWQALNYQFVSDDWHYITENHKLAGLLPVDLWRLFVEPYNPYEFLPLRDFSYWLDMKLFGLTPSVFRLHNIFLYLLCLSLLYGVTLSLWRYMRQSDAGNGAWVAAVVTALFALNPAHVEAVVWVSGRKDVLAAMFSLLALWFALNAKREQGISSLAAAATLVALAAAMLSKATAIVIAPVVALLWLIFWLDIPAAGRRRLLLLWPIACLLVAASLALVFMAHSTIREPLHLGVGMIVRALTVLGDLTRLALSPESRHFFYPGLDDPYLVVMIALGAVVLVAAAMGAAMTLRRRSLEGFCCFAFVLFCLPYMQILPYRTPSLVVDRFVFLAVWPATLLLVTLAWRLKAAPRILVLLTIALAWGFQMIDRPRDWISSEVMIDTDVKDYPGYYMPAFQKIMWVQLPRGLYQEAQQTAGSITDTEVLDSVSALVESEYVVHVEAVNTGNPSDAIVRLRSFESALNKLTDRSIGNPSLQYVLKYSRIALVDHWNHLAKTFPENVSVRFNAGMRDLYIDTDYAAAAVHLRAAIDSTHLPLPVRGGALKSLGLALINSGRAAEAEAPLLAALEQVPPDLQAHCLLSVVYNKAGRSDEMAHAVEACRTGVPNQGTLQ